MNPFRKVWLGLKIKQAIGGDMESVKSILSWIVKLNIVPSGWLTVGSGAVSILLGALCYFGVQVPGVECPADPTVMLTTGAGLIGLGRRGK